MFNLVLGRLFRWAAHPLVLPTMVLAILLLPFATEGELATDVGARVQRQGADWVVTWIDSGGTADCSGLAVGDVLVALDGGEPGPGRLTDPGLDLSGSSEWTVLRRGQTLILRPILEPEPWHNSGEPIVLLSIALAFWAIATLVRLYRPGDALAGRLFRLNTGIALALALTTASSADVVWTKIVGTAAFALLPAWFLDFFLWFARGTQPGVLASRAIRALFLAGASAGTFYVVAGMVDSDWYYPLRSVVLGLLAVGILGGLAVLLQAFVRPAAPESRRRIAIVLVAAGLASLPFVALAVVPVSLGLPAIVRPQVAALSTVLLPLGFAYAILRRGFLKIDIFVERALVYGTTTCLLAASYALFLYGLGSFREGAVPQDNPVLSVGFFAAVTLTFIPVRDWVRGVIDHVIYRDRYDYAWTLRDLGSLLASARPIDQVLGDVANRLARAMNLRGAAVFVRHPIEGMVMCAGSGECGEKQLAGSLAVAVSVQAGQGVSSLPGPGRWMPLAAHGEETGLLYLAPKRSSAELSADDLSLAETIAGQAAVAIANALLVEKLRAKVAELELLRDRLLRVQEEERKHLAQELHDGPLHTVLDLVRRAETSPGGSPPAREVYDRQAGRLHDLAERGRDVAHELRTICSDLYPSELAHLGLVSALDGLAHRVSREEDLPVCFTNRGFPVDRRLPSQVEDTLYRVAREAVSNACRHAEAGIAVICLSLEDGQVVLTVRDDGRGFVMPASSSALIRNGHLGLATMHERVERLPGRLVVVSAPGQGTEVRVRVPVPAGVRTDAPLLLPGAAR